MSFLKHAFNTASEKSLGGQELINAIKAGKVKTARKLLDRGASTEEHDVLGYTPLMWAVAENRPELVNLLLDKGADINAQDLMGGNTPFGIATFIQQRDMMGLLISRGAKFYVRNKTGATPLHLAAETGNTEALLLLLDTEFSDFSSKSKPHVDTPDNQHMTALAVALLNRHTEAATLLLDRGASPNATNQDGYNILSLLIKKYDMTGINLLMEHGVDPNKENMHFRESPLSIAVEADYASIARLLIDKGADVNKKNSFGDTPLTTAAKGEWSDVTARLLLEKGADINAQNNFGETALMVAVTYNSSRVISLLVEKGADLSLTNKHGKTALDIALEKKEGREEIAALLQKAMKVQEPEPQPDPRETQRIALQTEHLSTTQRQRQLKKHIVSH